MYCGSLLLYNENMIGIARLEIGDRPITSLAFHAECTDLLIADSSGKIVLLTDNKITTQWILPDSVVDVLWEDNTKGIAASGHVVYELCSAEPHHLLTVKTMIIQIVVDVLNKFLVVGEQSGNATIYDLRSKPCLRTVMLHADGVFSLAFCHVPFIFASGGRIRLQNW
jgi:WD40 repeat protein